MKTSYIYAWQLYLGCETAQVPRKAGVAHKVVSSCQGIYKIGGHVIYMDNFFFLSPELFHHLSQHGTGACSILCMNWNGVPNEIKNSKAPSRQDIGIHRDGDILYISWYDRKPVNLIMTAYTAETFRKEVQSNHHEDHTRIVYKPTLSTLDLTRQSWQAVSVLQGSAPIYQVVGKNFFICMNSASAKSWLCGKPN